VEHLWGNTLGKTPKSASDLVDLGGHNKNRFLRFGGAEISILPGQTGPMLTETRDASSAKPP